MLNPKSVIYVTLSFLIDKDHFFQIRDARSEVYKCTLATSNKGVERNSFTEGGVILYNFFVAPPRSAFALLHRCFANLSKITTVNLKNNVT